MKLSRVWGHVDGQILTGLLLLSGRQPSRCILFLDYADDILVTIYQYKWRHIPEQFNLPFVIDFLYSHNAKSHVYFHFLVFPVDFENTCIVSFVLNT